MKRPSAVGWFHLWIHHCKYTCLCEFSFSNKNVQNDQMTLLSGSISAPECHLRRKPRYLSVWALWSTLMQRKFNDRHLKRDFSLYIIIKIHIDSNCIKTCSQWLNLYQSVKSNGLRPTSLFKSVMALFNYTYIRHTASMILVGIP